MRIRRAFSLVFVIGAAFFLCRVAAGEPQPVQIEGVQPVYRAGQEIPFTLSNSSGRAVPYAAGVEYRERNTWFELVVNVEKEMPSGMQTFSQLDPKSARKLFWAPLKMPDYFSKGDYRIFVDVPNAQGRPTRYCSRSFRIEAAAKVPSSATQVPIEASPVKGAWLESDAKWTRVRADIAPYQQWAQISILYFDKDNKFGLINCTVNRQPESMSISPGDPRGVSKGKWNASDRSISIEYRLVDADIVAVGEKLPGPMKKGDIKVSGSTLTFEGKKYLRAAELDESAAEALYGIQAAARQ